MNWLQMALMLSFAVLLAHILPTSGIRTKALTYDLIANLSNEDIYDKTTHPGFLHGIPTDVTMYIYVESMSTFRADTMDFRVDIYLQMHWNDSRLQHNLDERILIRDANILNLLWLPNIYFANARKSSYHYVTERNFLVWIEPNGHVTYDTRVAMDLLCVQHLGHWPFDQQSCDIVIMSYAYENTAVNLQWIPMPEGEQPVSLNDMKLADMEIVRSYVQPCAGQYQSAKRLRMHHVTQSYAPTALIVIISWMSLWLHVDAVPGRIMLGITTLLTVVTLKNAATHGLPQSSYIRAIDVWMGACVAFVFGVLLEFVIANFFHRRQLPLLKRMQCDQHASHLQPHISAQTIATHTTSLWDTSVAWAFGLDQQDHDNHPSELFVATGGRGIQSVAERIDSMARIGFPLGFLCFNIAYWFYYLYWTELMRQREASAIE